MFSPLLLISLAATAIAEERTDSAVTAAGFYTDQHNTQGGTICSCPSVSKKYQLIPADTSTAANTN